MEHDRERERRDNSMIMFIPLRKKRGEEKGDEAEEQEQIITGTMFLSREENLRAGIQ